MVKVLQSTAVLPEGAGCSACQCHVLRASPRVSILDVYLAFKPKSGMQTSCTMHKEVKQKSEEVILWNQKIPCCLNQLGSENQKSWSLCAPLPLHMSSRGSAFASISLQAVMTVGYIFEAGPALGRHWSRWPPEIPSNLTYSCPMGTGRREIAQCCYISNGLWLKQPHVRGPSSCSHSACFTKMCIPVIYFSKGLSCTHTQLINM